MGFVCLFGRGGGGIDGITFFSGGEFFSQNILTLSFLQVSIGCFTASRFPKHILILAFTYAAPIGEPGFQIEVFLDRSTQT